MDPQRSVREVRAGTAGPQERLEELRRRWDEEHTRLKQLVVDLRQKAAANDGMASRYQAAVTRLRKFEEAGPPEVAPRDQNINMRLRGGRTGRRAIICEELELTGLMRPFDAEIWYGERVAVLGLQRLGQVPLPSVTDVGG